MMVNEKLNQNWHLCGFTNSSRKKGQDDRMGTASDKVMELQWG